MTFREITGTCSISPKSDGLSCQLLHCDYIYPFLSLSNSFLVQIFPVKDKPQYMPLLSSSLDKACSRSLCFTVHSIASHLFLFVGKKDKSVIAHVQLVLWGKPEGIGAKEVYSERVTPEEKGDVRKSGASPMGPMGVKMGWGRWGGRLSTTVTDQSSLGDILDQ